MRQHGTEYVLLPRAARKRREVTPWTGRSAPPGTRLHCGDCLAVLAALAAASVDVVVTSPPYNLDLAYAELPGQPRRGRTTWTGWSRSPRRCGG